MKKLLFSLLIMSTGLSMQAQENAYFTNPVIPSDVADPSLIRVGNDYYATGTSSEWAPHYPIFHSTDLVNWK
ncbi:MAG: family 43 glycosylhydrolase, partial [Bacteroidaceae bacterium]|nr:family 43 glycosylhydrolase [Bacteroidaceae bacterium]